jgi:hypothetical protein
MVLRNKYSLILARLSSPAWAAFILVSIAAMYSGGQEIRAIYSPHDSYYFILRSASFKLLGSYNVPIEEYFYHLAPIKEYLYSAFIKLSRVFGFSLRCFEVLCYGLAIFWLWDQTRKISESFAIAWMTALPLAVFTYQHPVFNMATYDGLQLILTPLSIASALQIVSKKGSFASICVAGLITGCQILTRPEGFLFIFPPLISLIYISYKDKYQFLTRVNVSKLLQRAALLCLLPIAFQQGMSAINQAVFGFWAPTIMKSAEFQAGLSALMSIKPTDDVAQRYAPFPKSSMQRAYDVSPAFLKAKPFFDQNIDGKRWSSHAIPGYGNVDGSIAGGHLQWALLDASAFVAGPKPTDMLAYLKVVSEEIRTAFYNGKLESRPLLSTAFGPQFSILDRQFWLSFWKLGSIILNFKQPNLPVLTSVSSFQNLESDFNQLTLRKTGLLKDHNWQVSGWLLNSALGLPKNILLDQSADSAGINLKLIKRPDVVKSLPGLDLAQTHFPMCGFELTSSGSTAGNLIVEYRGHVTMIPIENFKQIGAGHALDQDGIHIAIDNYATSKPFLAHRQFKIVQWVTTAVHYSMRLVSIMSITLLFIIIIFRKKLVVGNSERATLFLIAAIAFSLVLPRLGLLAAIDSVMYPGTEPRYLSTAAFPMWYFSTFMLGYCIRCVLQWRKISVPT